MTGYPAGGVRGRRERCDELPLDGSGSILSSNDRRRFKHILLNSTRSFTFPPITRASPIARPEFSLGDHHTLPLVGVGITAVTSPQAGTRSQVILMQTPGVHLALTGPSL